MTQSKSTENTHIMSHKYSWTLSNKLRNWAQPPIKLLDDNIKPGMKVLDFGCGNGYMTFPLVNLVGENGTVFAVDLQQEMLEQLMRRSKAHHNNNKIVFHQCESEAINLKTTVDAVVCCYVLHEVPNKKVTLGNLFDLLKDNGVFQLIEPPLHVPNKKFENEVKTALEVGFKLIEQKRIGLNHVAIFSKN